MTSIPHRMVGVVHCTVGRQTRPSRSQNWQVGSDRAGAAAPHGVIVGPDGAAWVTEGGQNAIARGWIPRPAPSQQKFVNRKNPQVRFACTLARTFVLHRELSFACCLRVGVLGRDGSVS
jgi:hypothetical protein